MSNKFLRCNTSNFTITMEKMKEIIEDVYKFTPTDETTEKIFRTLIAERLTVEAIRRMESSGRVDPRDFKEIEEEQIKNRKVETEVE